MPYDISLDNNKTTVLLVVFILLLSLVFIAGLLSGFLMKPPDQVGRSPVSDRAEKAASPVVVTEEASSLPLEEKPSPVPPVSEPSSLSAESKPEEKRPPKNHKKPKIPPTPLPELARAGWIVVDELKKGTSVWSVTNGVLLQSADMPEEDDNSGVLDQGTYALTGKNEWRNSSVSLKMRSHDDDAIGVLFRYQDPDNYYLFSMDSQRKYRRLVRKYNGTISVLAEDFIAYTTGKWYNVKIDLMDENINIELNETDIFEVTDGFLRNGKIGMYSRGNKGSEFKDVMVISFDRQEKSKEQKKLFDNKDEDKSIAENEVAEDDEKVSSTGPVEGVGPELSEEKETSVRDKSEGQEKIVTETEEVSVGSLPLDAVFSVQAGAFLNKNNADKFAARLKEKGYAAYVFKITDSTNRTWHAVRAGNYKDLQEASSGLAIFKSKEKIPAIITRIDSISVVNPVKTVIPKESLPEPVGVTTEDASTKAEETVLQTGETAYPYSIRLSSYRSLEETLKAISYYEKRGIPSYFLTIDLGERGVFRLINSGSYRSFEEADRARVKLKIKGAIVKKTPYACLIGVYALKDEMNKVIQDIQDQEYDPYFITGSNDTFRLYVGAFSTMKGAKQLKNELHEKNIESSIVER